METRVIDLTAEASPARRASATAVFTLLLGRRLRQSLKLSHISVGRDD